MNTKWEADILDPNRVVLHFKTLRSDRLFSLAIIRGICSDRIDPTSALSCRTSRHNRIFLSSQGWIHSNTIPSSFGAYGMSLWPVSNSTVFRPTASARNTWTNTSYEVDSIYLIIVGSCQYDSQLSMIWYSPVPLAQPCTHRTGYMYIKEFGSHPFFSYPSSSPPMAQGSNNGIESLTREFGSSSYWMSF